MRPTGWFMRRFWMVPALLMAWSPLARASEVVVVFGLLDRVTAGQVVQLSWTDLPADADEAEIELSLDGRRWVRISPQFETCERSWSWRVPSISASSARIRLRVGGEENGEEREVVAAVSRAFRIEGATASPPRDAGDSLHEFAPDDGGAAALSVLLPPLSHRHHRFPVRVRSSQSLQAPVTAVRLPLEPKLAAPATAGGAIAHAAPGFFPLRN